MSIAMSLQQCLSTAHVPYDVIEHPRSMSSLETAHAAHIEPARMAKCVILEDESGFLMAVLPSNARIEFGRLHTVLNRHVGLATEQAVAALFQDCEIGAVPPIGPSYGMEMIVEERLLHEPDLYIEAGDHRDLVHLSQSAFSSLLGDAAHVQFSRPLSGL